jgi:glucose/arabinose dehydrogenase
MSRRAVIATSVVAAFVAVAVWLAWYFGLIFTNPTVSGATVVDVPTSSVRAVASDLEAPWGIAFLPDGTALVTERDSTRVLSVTPEGATTEVARIAEARPSGEGGLLGIAVAPTYASDRWVYVYYTAADDNRIARLRLGSGDAPEPIFTGIPKAGNHNGGRIAFGPDGLLYVGTGDASDRDGAQDRAFLGGKILRLTADGQPAPGNPFPNSPVYSLGHRNVQGLAWDSSGQLFAAEFGQNRYDELNRIESGGNYGWPTVEGTGGGGDFIDPVATWATSDASPSGIAIVNDRVYIACLRGTKLYRVGTDGSGAAAMLTDEYGRLRAVAPAPDGSLWILTSNRDGRGDPAPTDDRILRLDSSAL